MRLLLIGDSRTAPGTGSWPEYFASYAASHFGTVVGEVVNYAEPGHWSHHQRLKIQETGLPGRFDFAVISIGTNDIQIGATIQQSKDNLNAIIDACQAASDQVVLMVPSLFYDRKTGNPKAANTSRYETGAQLRSMQMHLAAKRGLRLINLMNVLGPTVYSIDRVSSEPQLFDNIHYTFYAARKIGWHVAAALVEWSKQPLQR
jgi:hypothetical protein